MSVSISSRTICLILLSFFLFSNYTFSQDLEKIDNDFVNNNKIESNVSYINIYLNSNDCYRCFGHIHQILAAVEKEKSELQINILTDQVVFAKKNTKDYSVNKKYYVEHNIFQNHSSFYYYKNNGEIISDISQILNRIKKNNESISKNNKITSIQLVDDLFTSDNLTHVGIYQNQLIVYDNTIDLGGVINTENSNIEYYDITTSSKKLYNQLPLPFDSYKENFQLLSYEDFQNVKKDFPGIQEVKVTSIAIYNNIAFAGLMVNKMFQSTKDCTEYELPSFTYLAVKSINNKDSLSDIFNLDSYDYYFDMNALHYNSIDYRIGVSINYPFTIINEYSFMAKVFNELDYSGEATFELSDDYSQLNITSINSEAPQIYDLHGGLQINEKYFYVDKEMTDESTGEGIITLK